MRALNTSGRAVLFAGATVIVALLGLFVLGVSFLNGVAVASAIVVLITMTAAVTLIPALLGIIGMRVLSRKERRRLAERGPARPEARRLLAALGADRAGPPRAARRSAALIVMLALAIPALSLRLGSSDAGQDPASSTTRKAYDLLAKGFGAGLQRHVPDRRQDAERQGRPAEGPAARRHAEQDRRPGGGRARRCRRPNGKIALIEARPATAPQDAATSRPDRHAAQRRRAEGLRRAARLRRRHHRDLRRLRRRADRQAAAVHRRDRRCSAACC